MDFSQLTYNPFKDKNGNNITYVQEAYSDFWLIPCFDEKKLRNGQAIPHLYLQGSIITHQDIDDQDQSQSALPYTKNDYSVDLGLFNKKHIHKMLSAVILMCDASSPYVQGYKNWQVRKKQILKKLNIYKESPNYKEIHQEGIVFKQFVFQFFRILNDTAYEAWYSLRILFSQLGEKIRSNDTSIDAMKQKIASEPSYIKLQERLQKMEGLLFPEREIKRIINVKSIEDALGGYAEMFAEDDINLM